MPHGRHIYAKASDIAKAKMCAYPQSYHALPQCKCVMWCFAKFPSVNISDQEIDYQYSNTIPSICFHVYNLISRCTTRGKLPLNDKKKNVSVNRILIKNNQQKCTLEKS